MRNIQVGVLAIAALPLAFVLKHLKLSLLLGLLWFAPIALILYAARKAIHWSESHVYRYPSSMRERTLAPADGPVNENSFNTHIYEAPIVPLFPDNTALEEQFTKVLSIVLVGTLHSWFVHISKRHLFPNTVEVLLRTVARQCKERLVSRDIVAILVRRAVPILTQHLADFHNAEASVRRLDTPFEAGSELEAEAIAQSYRGGRLHRATKVSSTCTSREAQQAALRDGIVPKLLHALLPPGEASQLVYTLLRELMACSVLYPLFDMLTDPDFWNQLIVLHTGQAIQERAKIKRFRTVLEEQTVESPTMKKRFSRRKKAPRLEKLLVSGEPKEWDRVYRKIRKCSQLADLICMRRELVALRQEMLVATPSYIRHTTKEEAPLHKALALLESRVALLSGVQRQSTSLGTPTQMSFDQTLVHGSTYLREYLEDQGRSDLLDFLIQVPKPSALLEGQHLFKTEVELLCRQFLSSSVLAITQQERTYLTNYIANEPHDYDGEANEILQAIARRAHQTLEQEDFPKFKNSKLYMKMIVDEDESCDAMRSELFYINGRPSFDSSNDHTDEDEEVVERVENALHDLLVATPSRPASPLRCDDIIAAEPGDLELVERIAHLNQEIKKRTDHLSLIRHLLANTTTTESDVRVMEESQHQITQELNKLENQKAQFALQLDEQELFGRSRVSIDSYVMHRDQEGEYTAYLIEVRRRATDGSEAGWIIARRYSEFNELYNRLKQRFPHVATFEFPRKQLNRLKSVSEVRRPLLEAFLRSLLADERLCRSTELRAFLSQHTQHFPKRRHRSVLENFMTFTDPRDGVAKLFALLEGSEEMPQSSGSHPDLRDIHPAPLGHAQEDSDDGPLSSFAKPIVNLILEAFDLRDRGKWIQKRAVVLVLQQILGGTIEGRLRDQVMHLTRPQAMRAWLVQLETVLLDKLAMVDSGMGSAPVRSTEDKRRERELAFATCKSSLPPYIPDTALRTVFRALQNRTLNTHLLYTLADEVADAVFT